MRAAKWLLLVALAASPAARAQTRAPEPDRSASRPWVEHCFATLLEYDVGAAGGLLVKEERTVAGAAAHLGWRITDCAEHDTTTNDLLMDVIFGEYWGADLRLGWWQMLNAPKGSPALFSVGLGPALYNLVGVETSKSVFRVPTVSGLALPEIGAAFRTDGPASLYLAWSAPVAARLRSGPILQLAPALTILYRTPAGRPDALVSLTFTAVIR